MYAQEYLKQPVFLNFFFEAEPFAAVLIARGTHGHSQKFVYGEIVKFGAEFRQRAGKRFLERGQ